MLFIDVVEHEFYDSIREEFFWTRPFTAKFEHSLISISKWEAEFHKPFLPSRTQNGLTTSDEERFYISCMSIGKVPDYGIGLLFAHHREEIRDYIANPQTATVTYRIGNDPLTGNRGPTVTSELIYYWMVEFGIPFECERWPLNRLLTLLDVCNAKREEVNGKTNKLSVRDSIAHRHKLNQARMAG